MCTRQAYYCFLDKKKRQESVKEKKTSERESIDPRLFIKLYQIKMNGYKEHVRMYAKGLFNDYAAYGEQMHE